MRSLTKWTLAAGLMLAGISQAQAQNIAGTYSVLGETGNGQQYTGWVTVQQTGQAWNVTWNVAGQSTSGVGLLNNGVLSVAYTQSGQLGVAQYQMMTNGFQGLWTTRGANIVLRENWKR